MEVTPLDPNSNPIYGGAARDSESEVQPHVGAGTTPALPTPAPSAFGPQPDQPGPGSSETGWNFSKGILLRKLGENNMEIE